MPSRNEYASCASRGLTMREAAAELGVTVQSVSHAARRDGLTFRRPAKHPVPFTAEHRAKISAAKRGSKHSEATRAAISAGVRRAWGEGRVFCWTQELTRAEYAEYCRLTRRKSIPKAEALPMIGRGDLL